MDDLNSRFDMMAERLPAPMTEVTVIHELSPLVRREDGKYEPRMEGDERPVAGLLAHPLVIINGQRFY